MGHGAAFIPVLVPFPTNEQCRGRPGGAAPRRAAVSCAARGRTPASAAEGILRAFRRGTALARSFAAYRASEQCLGAPPRPPRPAAAGRPAPGAENPPGQPKAPKWQLEAGNTLLLSFVSMLTGRKCEKLLKQEDGRRERQAGHARAGNAPSSQMAPIRSTRPIPTCLVPSLNSPT